MRICGETEGIILFCTYPTDTFPRLRLLDFLVLQLDRLVVDEDALALVRLWHPPCPNVRRKLLDHLLVHAFQQYSRGLRRAGLDAPGYA